MGRAMVGTLLQSFSPWPTVLVNLIGAILIGFLVRAMEGMSDPDFFGILDSWRMRRLYDFFRLWVGFV